MATSLDRIRDEDVVGQLVRRDGRMAELGSEDGVLKLDWVTGVERVLADPNVLETIEAEAAAIRDRGIRHIIWSGMGGSVMAVHVVNDLISCTGDTDPVLIHPLDSTDPAAINAVMRAIAPDHDVPVDPLSPGTLPILLHEVMMIAVSMGMTSEEPITHLEWFLGLLETSGLSPKSHCLVMTLPGSYLERFAHERDVPSLPLQLDGGTGTGGRMSAPTTRVFLLPAAIALRNKGHDQGTLRTMLRAAWATHGLADAVDRPQDHPYIRLAATLSNAAVDGAVTVMLETEHKWAPIAPWVEQLMEESLGKAGKGVTVFDPADLSPRGLYHRSSGSVHVSVGPLPRGSGDDRFTLPTTRADTADTQLTAATVSFLGWQLCMAVFGYLHDIHFAGQPAVEDYKARARGVRADVNPLATLQRANQGISFRTLTMYGPGMDDPTSTVQAIIAYAIRAVCPPYLDLTINGEAPHDALQALSIALHRLGNDILGVPVKLRRAPAAYHSTEQSEMDGPPNVLSIRVMATTHESPNIGQYDARFLAAQAIGTWTAMNEAGRQCYLAVLPGDLRDLSSVTALLNDISAVLQEVG